MVGCGTNQPSLNIVLKPSDVTLFTSYSYGTTEYIQLGVYYTDGTPATGAQWSSSAPCVPVDQTGIVRCNLTCAGHINSTITATVRGLSANSQVTCSYN